MAEPFPSASASARRPAAFTEASPHFVPVPAVPVPDRPATGGQDSGGLVPAAPRSGAAAGPSQRSAVAPPLAPPPVAALSGAPAALSGAPAVLPGACAPLPGAPAAPRLPSAVSPPDQLTPAPARQPTAATFAPESAVAPPDQLTPALARQPMSAASLAGGRPADRAEAPDRPAAPAVSIGTIEVTLLTPPRNPAPVRPAEREPRRPQPRLSRGLGRRFGQGQT